MRRHWRPNMPALLPPARMHQCSGSSRSFLRGPDGPRGASTWTSPALRRSYRARESAGQSKIRITKSPQLQGNPGILAATHLWWHVGGPAEDPYATDPVALHEGRQRVAALADIIVPGHGKPFSLDAAVPR